jgi:hypothetical protein
MKKKSGGVKLERPPLPGINLYRDKPPRMCEEFSLFFADGTKPGPATNWPSGNCIATVRIIYEPEQIEHAGKLYPSAIAVFERSGENTWLETLSRGQIVAVVDEVLAKAGLVNWFVSVSVADSVFETIPSGTDEFQYFGWFRRSNRKEVIT